MLGVELNIKSFIFVFSKTFVLKFLTKFSEENEKSPFKSVFGFFASEDAKNSVLNVPHLYGGGLGLPDRDYYFDSDKKDIRSKFARKGYSARTTPEEKLAAYQVYLSESYDSQNKLLRA